VFSAARLIDFETMSVLHPNGSSGTYYIQRRRGSRKAKLYRWRYYNDNDICRYTRESVESLSVGRRHSLARTALIAIVTSDSRSGKTPPHIGYLA